ncbi:methylmalonyl-CoA epimerase [Desulfoluna sp.]|uniref:methylmalonyl-CoA epimerase n=1 Tax=Desulfoluna sp. TaxID=2045199 RepID=UPI00260BEA4D|nr:methylmalonyl-CoA epimerase [Desulfoluna sp.]
MKVLHVDHIGIAVHGIDAGRLFWEDVLGLSFEGEETVVEQKVTTAFFPVGESEVELLEAVEADSPVGRYLAKRGEGVHHIAFRVEDIDAALQELKAKGIRLIDEIPRTGAGGARIAFIHPKETQGVLVELCERSGKGDGR